MANITLPVRKEYDCDVLVAGGGVSGLSAAVSAARQDARVILCEAGGVLGGTATQGLVGPFMTCYDKAGKTQIIRGFFSEVVERMVAEGGAVSHTQCPGGDSYSGYRHVGHIGVTPFFPETLKRVAEDFCAEAKVKLLYHSRLVACDTEEQLIRSAYFANVSGIEAVRAKVFIDTTGNAALAAGMRTHILVCVGAALSTLVGLYVVQVLHFTADPMRVGAQVISGIGFLGAGMILVRERLQVTGLTTAAGLWATATIGLAVGIGFYEASLISAVLVLATNAIFPRLERSQKVRRNLVYAELESADCVNEFVRYLYASNRVSASCITGPKSNLPKAVGVEVELSSEGEDDLYSLCGVLAQLDYVVFAVEVQQ